MGKGPVHLEIVRRRERVRRLIVRHVLPCDIAEKEGVDKRTIERDIKFLRDKGVKFIQEATAEQLAQSALEVYHEIQNEGWAQYHKASVDLKAKVIDRRQWAIERGIAIDKIRHTQADLDRLFEKVGIYKGGQQAQVEIHQYIQMFERFTKSDWEQFAPQLTAHLERHPEAFQALVRWGMQLGLLEEPIEGTVKVLGDGKDD